jgi:hypothetical protein
MRTRICVCEDWSGIALLEYLKDGGVVCIDPYSEQAWLPGMRIYVKYRPALWLITNGLAEHKQLEGGSAVVTITQKGRE